MELEHLDIIMDNVSSYSDASLYSLRDDITKRIARMQDIGGTLLELLSVVDAEIERRK